MELSIAGTDLAREAGRILQALRDGGAACAQAVLGPAPGWRRRCGLASGEQERWELLEGIVLEIRRWSPSAASGRSDNAVDVCVDLLEHLAGGARDQSAGTRRVH